MKNNNLKKDIEYFEKKTIDVLNSLSLNALSKLASALNEKKHRVGATRI